MTTTEPTAAATAEAMPPGPVDEHLTERALRLALTGTTDMANDVLFVPLTYYRDPDLADSERSDILTRTPLALAPSSQLAAVHDYVVRDVLGVSVLMTRDDSGTARAFLNYCRHRGASPAAGCGTARRFTCPYHAWTYNTAGQLVGQPGSEGFAGIDAGDHGLVELPSEERHGFVWVILTAGHPIDVAAHLGPLDTELAARAYGTYGYLTERTFTSAVNWKAALEAFAEGYHFPYVHGQSLIGQNTLPNTSTHDAFGRHHRLGFPFRWITDLTGEPGPAWDPTAHLGLIYWIFPNLVLANSPVGVEIIDILPATHPDGTADPTQCTVRHAWMARQPATDDETRMAYLEIYDAVHAAVRDEDFAMLPSCGNGIRHAQHHHMVIGRNEIGVQHIIRTLAETLDHPLPARDPRHDQTTQHQHHH